MRTGQVQDKERTSSEHDACQRIATVHLACAFFRWSPLQVLCMQKTFHRIERISPDKERIRHMRNGQETHTSNEKRTRNACGRWNSLKILLSVGRPLTLLGKVWQTFIVNVSFHACYWHIRLFFRVPLNADELNNVQLRWTYASLYWWFF